MPTLHVRNVPAAIYTSLRKRTREHKTSIASETVRLLERALRVDKPAIASCSTRSTAIDRWRGAAPRRPPP
jgi:plasmid stability protein